MRRYTTPTHIFILPFDTSIIAKLRLIYAQSDTIVFVKEAVNCDMRGNTLSVTLTQEETAKLDCKKNFVEIQMHILTQDEKSLVSKPVKVAVEKCLDTEVLV